MKHRYTFIALAFAATTASAQYWEQRTDFPSVNQAAFGFTIGDRMFAGGGISGLAPFTGYSGFNEYLPATDEWVPRTPCPGPVRYGVSGFELHGKGYVACGWATPGAALTDLWEYDPTSDNWTQKSNFPGAARYSCVSVSAGGKAYLGLGYVGYLNDWWEYDGAADQWTQRASLPAQGRQACTAFVIDDQIYVTAGARDVVALTANFFQELWRYSPLSDSWTLLAPLPADGRVGAYGFSYGGVGYVVGGNSGDADGHYVLNDMWAYRPAVDQWYQMGLFPGEPMSSGFAFSTSTTCYIGTGVTAVQSNSWVATELTDAFWAYHPTGLVGVGEQEAADDLRIRTAADGLVVEWPATSKAQQLQLIDMEGRAVRTQAVGANSGQALCSTIGLANGLYVVQLTGDAFAERRKVMVGPQ
ncbi:MAG: hypothetical protein ABI432_07035 [Flavobacteriales bacterium]